MNCSRLSASNLTIGYRQGSRSQTRIQQGLNFSLREGRLTCFLGPNGAGKSTLLRTISGMQPALGGSLLLDGKELCAHSERERSRLIGLVLTDTTYAGGLLVEELVALGRHPHSGFFGRLGESDYEQVAWAMEQVGITYKAKAYISELSDGERQKVMIAKALAQECPIILLDEPTAFLDVISRIEVMHLLHRLSEQGKTILLSTHDIEQALLLSDDLWMVSRESGFRSGATEDMVLGGELDRFFSRGEISFDHLRGSFRMDSSGQEIVTIEGSQELACWAHNALLRNGLKGVGLSEATQSARLHLKIESPTSLIVEEQGAQSRTFESYGAMTDYLITRK